MTDFAVVDTDEVAAEPFPESGLSHRKLTEQLGCTDVRVNAVTLAPGEATAPHAHERQEELYVALDGGRVEIDTISASTPSRRSNSLARSPHPACPPLFDMESRAAGFSP